MRTADIGLDSLPTKQKPYCTAPWSPRLQGYSLRSLLSARW